MAKKRLLNPENKKKHAEYFRQYRINNPVKIASIRKKYNDANKEKIKKM